MDLQDGPSTSFNTQKKNEKTILSDIELLDILETGTFLSDEDFGIDSNDDELEIGNLPDENEINNVDEFVHC